MNAHDEKDPVWELLKKSPPPKASPFFSRNVVREARKQEPLRAGKGHTNPFDFFDFGFRLGAWFRRPVNALGAAVLAAGLVAVSIAVAPLRSGAPALTQGEHSPATTSAVANERGIALAEPPVRDRFDAAEEIENLEYLGQLMAVADPASLDDAALADLFF